MTRCPSCSEPVLHDDPRTLDGSHAVCLPGPPARIETTEVCGRCHEYRALSGACACE